MSSRLWDVEGALFMTSGRPEQCLCALGVLCERKMSHAESAEIAEALGLGGVEIEGR